MNQPTRKSKTRRPSLTLLASMVALASACAPDSGRSDEVATDEGALPEAAAVPESAAQEETAAIAPIIVDIPAFEGHDSNRDGVLSRDEFGAWIAENGVHASWVYEADGDLDVGAVSSRLLGLWDQNEDSLLSEPEWDGGVRSWFPPDEAGAFSDWDGNGDGSVDAIEAAVALGSRGLYDRIDGDGNTIVDDRELADWLFGVIDASGDGGLDQAEWEAAQEKHWVG